jgi:aryl-alcohol dehydrogenase-like predicted oxidoreductase
MEYRKLGHSQLSISEIGFGCMSLQTDHDANTRIIHQAIELGINFFDTADLYNNGMNEVSVGKALKQKRSQVMLATKAGNQWRQDGSGWDWNPRKEYILQAINKSLERLQTDYIDLYQLHGGTMEDPIDETIEAFELLKQQGKIRYYGISSIRPNVIREYIKRSSITSVMMQYSLLDRRPEECCLQLLQQNNIGVLSRGALAQGLLVNKPAKEYLGYSAEAVSKAAAAVKAVATPINDNGNVNNAAASDGSGLQSGTINPGTTMQPATTSRTAAQTALQFVLHHAAITSAVAGIRTMEQLQELAAASDSPPLTAQEFQLLSQSVPALAYEQHR